MGRGLLAHPEWHNREREGRTADIRPCISTNECHGRGRMICTVNPAATREQEMILEPATTPRRVLVVGAGPAGTEAAIVAARRGHEVLLCEREETLGGQARLMSLDPGHAQLRRWLEYTERQLPRTGVEVRCSTEVTAESARQWTPEAIILATGARPAIPAIPGVTARHVATAQSVLRRTAPGGRPRALDGRRRRRPAPSGPRHARRRPSRARHLAPRHRYHRALRWNPPSTLMNSPLMYPAGREHRNAIVAAISPGSPTRPAGMTEVNPPSRVSGAVARSAATLPT